MIRADIFQEAIGRTQPNESVQLRALLEDVRQQLDPDMTGWTQAGGSATEMEASRVDLQTLRRNSQEAFRSNPHGKVAIRTPVKFAIGGGCLVDFHEKDEAALKAIAHWWKRCTKSVKWYSFTREYMTRAARDGELFVRRFDTPDASPLLLRFIDPDRVPDEGIKTDPRDVETVLTYDIIGPDGTPETVDAADIHHFKGFNVDRNVKRGRPNLEVILPTLRKYGKWLDARLVLSLVRNSVALVKQVSGTGQDLLRLRSSQQATRTKPGETNKVKMLQPGTILQGTPGVEYKMLSTNLDAKDAAEDGRTFLLAAAAGAGLPDVFMTSDYANANFASTVVAQNPAVREFEEIQQMLMEQFAELVDWFMLDGFLKQQFPTEVEEEGKARPINLDFDITFPPILRRDVAQESAAYATLNERGVISKRTWALKMGLDPDLEQKYIDEEGGPSVSVDKAKAPPKRVQDRNPRQNVQVGESDEKIATLAVVVKKKGRNNADKSLDVEYQMLRQEPDVEVGGDWPEKHAASGG